MPEQPCPKCARPHPTTEPCGSRYLLFHSDAFSESEQPLLVTHVNGCEECSRPYRFDLELASKRSDIDFTEVLKHNAWLGIKTPVEGGGSTLRKFHGILMSIQQLEQRGGYTRYRAVLVPKLWKLSLNVRTRIFQDGTLQDFLTEMLTQDYGLRHPVDFEFKCKKGPKREYVCQYQESDLDFFCRRLEHEGIRFHFEQGEDAEKIVCSDSTEYPPVYGNFEVQHTSAAEGASIDTWHREQVITSFVGQQQQIPKTVILKDYNWRCPSEDLRVEQEVCSDGVGTVYYYGDHYKDKNEGKALATARSQEIASRLLTFEGQSNHKGFRAGHRFKLKGHYRESFNGEYIITHVRCTASDPCESGQSIPDYQNTFTCIPNTDLPLRPERRTPRPSIHGIMNGKTDAAGDGKYAEIDDQGRYKIILPFDLSGRGGGKASRYLRMAQPYSGPGYGHHCPLHKNTEVLLACIDGDPDRMIIVGTVPNPENSSPVTGSNQSQSILRTGAGNEILMEDSDGARYMQFVSPEHNTRLSLGADHHSEHCPPGATLLTHKGISIAAGDGISIAAGSSSHDIASEEQKGGAANTAHTMALVAAAGAVVGGLAADAVTPAITTISSLIGDAAGFAMGIGLPGVYIYAPGKCAMVTPGEAVVGAGMSADIVAFGPANILSVTDAMVHGMAAAAITSLLNVEMISAFGNVEVRAKYRGNVEVRAKKAVEILADTKCVEISAQTYFGKRPHGGLRDCHHGEQSVLIESSDDFCVVTHTGKGHIEINKDLLIESKNEKKIVLKAGKSTIEMTDSKIQLKGDTIELITNDGVVQVLVGKEGSDKGFSFHVDTQKAARIQTVGSLVHHSEDGIAVSSPGPVHIEGHPVTSNGSDIEN